MRPKRIYRNAVISNFGIKKTYPDLETICGQIDGELNKPVIEQERQIGFKPRLFFRIIVLYHLKKSKAVK